MEDRTQGMPIVHNFNNLSRNIKKAVLNIAVWLNLCSLHCLLGGKKERKGDLRSEWRKGMKGGLKRGEGVEGCEEGT